MISSYVVLPSNVVKPSDAYYKYSTNRDFENNTTSSNSSAVYDTTRTLIIAISVPGFVVMVILVILSMLCLSRQKELR